MPAARACSARSTRWCARRPELGAAWLRRGCVASPPNRRRPRITRLPLGGREPGTMARHEQRTPAHLQGRHDLAAARRARLRRHPVGAARAAADALSRRAATSSRSGAAQTATTTGPARINGRSVDFLIDTGATGTAISAALARELELQSIGQVQSSTAGGPVTGQVVRADVTCRAACAPSGCAWSRCRRSPTGRCSAWTCSADCTGSSATA